MPLTVKQIEAAVHGRDKERLGDGSGLFLRLYPSGSKRFQILVPAAPKDKRRVWISLGDFPTLGLKSARELALWARMRAGEGWTADRIRSELARRSGSANGVPAETSKARRRTSHGRPATTPGKPSFETVARQWFRVKSAGLSNGKHVAQNWTTVESYVLPALGHKAIDAITMIDVVACLRPIWREKHETARRTLARVREIFELARLEHGLPANPAQFDPQIAYGRVQQRTNHFRSLRFSRAPEFWRWLSQVNCDEMTRQFAMLIVLTAKRTGEVRFARFDEFDAVQAIWTTPAEKMKMRVEHRVPLSSQALIVLENMRCLNHDQANLFGKPSNRSGLISENAALNLVQCFDPEITTHGFRASFKGWARYERHYQRDAIEFALAHSLPPLDAAYFREDLMEERAPMMQAWADFLTDNDKVRSIAWL